VISDIERMYEHFPRCSSSATPSRPARSRVASSRSRGGPRPDAAARLMLLDEPSFGLAPLVVRDLFKIPQDQPRGQGHHPRRRAERAACARTRRPGLCDRDRPHRDVGKANEIANNEDIRKSIWGY